MFPPVRARHAHPRPSPCHRPRIRVQRPESACRVLFFRLSRTPPESAASPRCQAYVKQIPNRGTEAQERTARTLRMRAPRGVRAMAAHAAKCVETPTTPEYWEPRSAVTFVATTGRSVRENCGVSAPSRTSPSEKRPARHRESIRREAAFASRPLHGPKRAGRQRPASVAFARRVTHRVTTRSVSSR
jgi:hypothetical protein